MHELIHAYQIFKLIMDFNAVNFDPNDDDVYMRILSKKNGFFKSNAIIGNIISSVDADKKYTINERLLAKYLYYTAYTERCAYVGTFFEDVIKDQENKKLKPIDQYEIYSIYKKIIDEIGYFNDQSTFNEYKEHVENMIGKRNATLNKFKKRIYELCLKELSRMERVYDRISEFDIVKLEDLDIKKMDEKYYQYKENLYNQLTEGLSAEDKAAKYTYLKYYAPTKWDILRKQVKEVFNL
jgi:hypothetical protein